MNRWFRTRTSVVPVSLFAILALVAFTSCSRMVEPPDPRPPLKWNVTSGTTGGKKSFLASSDQVSSTPYSYKSTMVFGCTADEEFAGFSFTSRLSLSNAGTLHGNGVTREHDLTWGDEAVIKMELFQPLTGATLNFDDDAEAIRRMGAPGATTLLLELDLTVQGSVSLRYSLKGAAAGIEEARGECEKL